jgi:thioredoxin 1
MSHIELNKDNFNQEVLKFDGKVLVDFWAPWCGPCQMLGPVIEELSTELEGKAKVAKVNVDENQELSVQYNVSSIPMVLIFDKGEIKQTILGFRPKNDYLDALK